MSKVNYSMLPLNDNEILLDNNHKLVEINGEYVEMKYCIHCKEWHVLSDFAKNAMSQDGLQSWCKECSRKSSRARYAKMKSMIMEKEAAEVSFEQEQVEENDFFSEGMDFISKMQVRDKEQQQEILRLKEEIKTLKDKSISLDSLSEREIEMVLKSNKIAPRLLFEAITRQDDRYTFYARDSVSGLSFPIKVEVA